MIRKHFTLSEEEVEIIEKVKNDLRITNDSEAVRYMIKQYVRDGKKENGYLLSVLRGIEARTDLLLDIANTDLIKRNEEVCYPISMVESPVIKKARELRKKSLAHKKQKTDHRRRKGQE